MIGEKGADIVLNYWKKAEHQKPLLQAFYGSYSNKIEQFSSLLRNISSQITSGKLGYSLAPLPQVAKPSNLLLTSNEYNSYNEHVV
jgi:hypothetical protein